MKSVKPLVNGYADLTDQTKAPESKQVAPAL
jgi:hypothetical protein